MLALVFEGEREIALKEDQPLPRVLKPTDAIVRVSLCAICGSDLHPFRGDERGIARGTIVGHEVRMWLKCTCTAALGVQNVAVLFCDVSALMRACISTHSWLRSHDCFERTLSCVYVCTHGCPCAHAAAVQSHVQHCSGCTRHSGVEVVGCRSEQGTGIISRF